jgi:hypothetical protein
MDGADLGTFKLSMPPWLILFFAKISSILGVLDTNGGVMPFAGINGSGLDLSAPMLAKPLTSVKSLLGFGLSLCEGGSKPVGVDLPPPKSDKNAGRGAIIFYHLALRPS